jgi:hypothetical protein
MKNRSRSKNHSGAALVTAIFAILLLTLLGLSMMSISESARTVSKNNTEAAESFYIAEAGLAHAVGLLKSNGKDFDVNTVIPSIGSGLSFGAGQYTVSVSNGAASDEKTITSIGYGKNNSSATVRATYKFSSASSTAAIVINGDVNISGGLKILGTLGIIHTNGNMIMGGNNRAEQHYSSTGTMTPPTGSPCPNGSVTGAPPGCDAAPDLRSGQNPIPVPDVKPTDFISQADYFLVPPNPAVMPAPLAANPKPVTATIYDKNGNIMASGCDTGGCWGGWTYNSNQGFVINSGSTLPSGTYYGYQSSIQCNRTFGSSATSLSISFVADGHLSFSSGASYLAPKAIFNGNNYAAVAGGDVGINGANLNTTSTQGIFYARHQFALEGGQPKIFGKIYVYNEADVTLFQANPVQRQSGTAFRATGDPEVTCNETSSGSASPGVTLINWNEIRN